MDEQDKNSNLGMLGIANVLGEHSRRIKKENTKSALSDALAELSSELKILAKEKNKLEREMNNTINKGSKTKELIGSLKERLARLEVIELEFDRKVSYDEHKLADVKSKLNKVKKAREELSDY